MFGSPYPINKKDALPMEQSSEYVDRYHVISTYSAMGKTLLYVQEASPFWAGSLRQMAGTLSLGLIGIGLVCLLWYGISFFMKGDLPTPFATAQVFWDLIKNPFYDNGPNDKGLGLQTYYSIIRVLIGFTIGSCIAIPLGIAMGSSQFFRAILYPIVQILRPVSPLAWFPIGLAVLKNAPSATIFIIAITCLWPTLINTAFGVASLPDDHKNVGKAFGFSKKKYLLKILIPWSLPHIMTGLRLSIGVAWLVIVAGEMLSGGLGIGFFVWDAWNALSLEKVISGIITIGIIGLGFDRLFNYIESKLSY